MPYYFIEMKNLKNTSNGITPLYHAVIADDVNLTKLLLDNGANVNDIYFNNISLLHLASERQNLDMIMDEQH